MLVIMFLQLAVYGLLPVQIHIVMLGIALAWRERSPVVPTLASPTPSDVADKRHPALQEGMARMTASISSGDVVTGCFPCARVAARSGVA